MSGPHSPVPVVRTLGETHAVRAPESGVREFIAFSLGAEQYALPLACVREILRMPPITPVPRAAPDVLGIISVRGQVTTLLDLRRRLSLPSAPLTTKARVLLVEHTDEVIGLACDRVHEVYRLREDEVELASVLGAQVSSHVMGIGRPGRGDRARRAPSRGAPEQADLLILLDPIALLKRLGHG